MGGIAALQEALRRFARERDWEQYHTPKNLVMALTGEVGELADLFQWLTAEESMILADDAEKRAEVEMELADTFQYLLRLADALEVDLEQVTWETIERNEKRFPSAPDDSAGSGSLIAVDDLVATLTDPTGVDTPDEFPSDPVAADGPGMYAWWATDTAQSLLSGWLGEEIPALIYAGQAGATRWPSGTQSSATLHSRISRNHIRGNAHSSTFRKTLSAILLEPLQLSIDKPGRLTPESRKEVTDWIREHLKVKIAPFDDRDRLGQIETEILACLNPPFNIERLPSSGLRLRLAELRRHLSSQ